jgi:anti-sigma regulatory factor (Ser/Thr protein kinase)
MRFITLQPPVDGAGAQWQVTGTNGCLKTLGVTPDTRAGIALALGEACANVVQHAGLAKNTWCG